ncbi:MAG: putative metallopeptidase, partial [Saprospiraceae bacterium]
VDSTLMEYFNRFVTEGASRNVTVDYESARVSGYIRTIQTQNVIGQCVHDSNQPNTVIIDRDYWSTGTDLEREFLVFHELGHCVLNREHMDDADENGICISIMTSGSPECRLSYTLSKRKKLLDELFMK